MAVIKTSGFIDGIKGKLGGSVHQYTQGGLTNRTNKNGKRTVQNIPQTQRAILATIAGSWSLLSSAQRNAWEAITPSYPSFDKFGNSRVPSAYNLYTKWNAVLANLGFTTYDAPNTPSSGAMPTSPFYSGTNAISPVVSWVGNTTGSDVICFAFTPNLSPGRAMPISCWRTFGAFPFPTTFSFSYGSFYYANYGLGIAGQAANCKFRVIDPTTGYVRYESTCSTILT
jgi:hypothetical protein